MPYSLRRLTALLVAATLPAALAAGPRSSLVDATFIEGAQMLAESPDIADFVAAVRDVAAQAGGSCVNSEYVAWGSEDGMEGSFRGVLSSLGYTFTELNASDDEDGRFLSFRLSRAGEGLAGIWFDSEGLTVLGWCSLKMAAAKPPAALTPVTPARPPTTPAPTPTAPPTATSATSSTAPAWPTPATCKVPPAVPPKPLTVQGYVWTCAGQPLAGVEVAVPGVTARGDRTALYVKTDAKGFYSTRVPDGFYTVSAGHEVSWQGKPARFNLHPEGGVTESRDAARGISQNFIWRLDGLKPGQRAGERGTHTEGLKYHGEYISLVSQEHGFSGLYFRQGTVLTVTLTPQGKLVDGRAGTPLVYRWTVPKDVTSSLSQYLTDIPVGVYTVTVQAQAPGGAPERVNLKRSGDFNAPYTPSVTLDFKPGSFGDIDMQQLTLETRPLR